MLQIVSEGAHLNFSLTLLRCVDLCLLDFTFFFSFFVLAAGVKKEQQSKNETVYALLIPITLLKLCNIKS